MNEWTVKDKLVEVLEQENDRLKVEIDRLTTQRDYKDTAIKRLRKKQKNQAKEINRQTADIKAKDGQIRLLRLFRTILESTLRVLDRGENIEHDSICHEEIEQALKGKQ